MPAMLIGALLVVFYFVPAQLLSDVINILSNSTADAKIALVKNFLKGALLLSFAACFIESLMINPGSAVMDNHPDKSAD